MSPRSGPIARRQRQANEAGLRIAPDGADLSCPALVSLGAVGPEPPSRGGAWRAQGFL